MNIYLSDFELMSSLGCDKNTFWDNLVRGRSIISNIQDRVSDHFPIRQAAIVQSDLLPEISEMKLRSEVEISFDYLYKKLISNAPKLESTPIDGLIWASSQFGRKVTDFLSKKPATYENFFDSSEFENYLSKKLHFSSPSSFINQSNACVTGITAIESAQKRIRQGHWKRALIFVHEARCREWILSPYLQMGLLSQKEKNGVLFSSPFSQERSGFVKGEGAVLLLIESEEALNERSARPYVKILSSSQRSDGENIIKMSQGAHSALQTLNSLFENQSFSKEDVQYINGYGSGSKTNDLDETKIYKSFFGTRAYEIPVSTGKPQFGHLNTAAAAIEIVSVALMMRNNTICPTIHFNARDPQCDLDYIPNYSRKQKINIALKTAFGFGWSNAAILLQNVM